MERLTQRNADGSVKYAKGCYSGCEYLTCGMEEGYQCNHQCEADIVCKLADYEDAEEQGLLLRLPCDYNESLFWVVNGHIKEVWFKGIRCDKGYKPQIIARYLEGLSSKEVPITKLENIGKTVFLTKEEAEKALKQRGE